MLFMIMLFEAPGDLLRMDLKCIKFKGFLKTESDTNLTWDYCVVYIILLLKVPILTVKMRTRTKKYI